MSDTIKPGQNYRNFTSRFAGRVSNMKRPKWSVSVLIRVYKRRYGIDLSEFVVPNKGFINFNSFFTRKLKPGVRKIETGIISPVDGFLFDFGRVSAENRIFVKHKHYYIEDLITNKFDFLKSYTVFYLSPANYHRVHACFDMEINSAVYLPGTLRSVREKTVYKKNRVYCRNERIVLSGNSDYGRFYFVLVGALLVGKVKLSFDSGLQTNIRKGIMASKDFDKSIFVKKGEEIGHFEMGSSVILLMETDILSNLKIELNSSLKMGQSLL